MIELKTKRLVLKLPRGKDAHALVERLNDYEVVKWLSNIPHPYTVSDAEDWVRIVNKSINDEEPSLQLSIFMNDSLIGGVGLRRIEAGLYELGYWLARDCWGNGLALEAATELLRYGQEKLAEPRIIAHCAKDNAASMSVLQKLGFRLTGEREIYFTARGRSMRALELALK